MMLFLSLSPGQKQLPLFTSVFPVAVLLQCDTTPEHAHDVAAKHDLAK